MIKTTKAQRRTLLAKFKQSSVMSNILDRKGDFEISIVTHYRSYRHMRKQAKGTFGCDGAITIYWCNMWLCIEKDGYCHS